MVTTIQLAKGLKYGRLKGDPHLELTGIHHDSRAVAPGDLFACVPGHTSGSRSFVAQARQRGASALLAEPPVHEEFETQILVPSVREALPVAARAIFGAPPSDVAVGITGTNGKTSVAYLVESLMREAGLQPALVGSIESRSGSVCREAGNTTPEADQLHAFWNEAHDGGADALVMEVSSHALLLHRSDGMAFSVGVFTNLTRDHLDYHPNFTAYRGAKSRLFGGLRGRAVAVINRDDPAWEDMARACSVRVITYGTTPDADIHPRHVTVSAAGIEMEVQARANRYSVVSKLYGRFNVANILAAVGCGTALGFEPDIISRGIESTAPVTGRAERIDCGQPFTVLNDFAHTPDALQHILAAARELTGGSLHVVFGCGGDRDPGKRPQMGQVAFESADRVTVTSDNPRTEDPQKILDEITAPLNHRTGLTVQIDRTKAILTALAQQRSGDTLVVAGKGHERYQIIGTTRHVFDDADVIRRELLRLGYGT
jgi:UDP-N-acetylmuramoyl-L-alanyl-D-glutamate--2,6-diaminopimelate ligase